jgi:hypothetical protein
MLLVARITINEMNNPTVAVVCIQEVQYPLWPTGHAPYISGCSSIFSSRQDLEAFLKLTLILEPSYGFITRNTTY